MTETKEAKYITEPEPVKWLIFRRISYIIHCDMEHVNSLPDLDINYDTFEEKQCYHALEKSLVDGFLKLGTDLMMIRPEVVKFLDGVVHTCFIKGEQIFISWLCKKVDELSGNQKNDCQFVA